MNPYELSLFIHGCTSLNLLFFGFYIYLMNKNSRRWWVRPINRKRDSHGFYMNIFLEMKNNDHEEFFELTRIWPHQFNKLLRLVCPRLIKSSRRPSLSPELRLAVTLSYLAHGDSINSKAWEFRIGKSTTREIIYEICNIIWDILQPIYLPSLDENRWLEIANDFQTIWQFPNCVGALDGCHIPIKAPPNSGSSFYCFKKFFSINLMAICDAKYKFTWVDIGQYGSISDSGVWANTVLAKCLETKQVQLPPPQALPGSTEVLPHFFVADEGFPLKEYLMHPYSRHEIGVKERVFNYRLSRARRIIENCFGILKSRWQILFKGLKANANNSTCIVNALVCLHNYLRTEEEIMPEQYQTYSKIDRERSLPEVLLKFNHIDENFIRSKTAAQQRDALRDYFLTSTGISQVPWQFQSALGGFNINVPS